tara:strand:- start:1794 stop:2408 length:615 start_codon:yes stop_codon:yes gene_type:complete
LVHQEFFINIILDAEGVLSVGSPVVIESTLSVGNDIIVHGILNTSNIYHSEDIQIESLTKVIIKSSEIVVDGSMNIGDLILNSLLVEDDINCEVILSVGDGATVNGILTTSNIYNENEIVIQSKDTIRLIGSNIILDGAMEYNFSDDVVSIDAVLSVGGSIVCAKFDSVSEIDVDAPIVRFSSNVHVGGETLIVVWIIITVWSS